MSSRNQAIGIFALVQVALTIAALRSAWFSLHDAFMIGVGDSQIALAAALATISGFRWGFRLPVVLILFVSGWAMHYVVWVRTVYPYLSVEDVLTSPLLAVAIYIGFTARHFYRGTRLIDEHPTMENARLSGKQFTLRDLLSWIVGTAAILAIGRLAISLTDVGGMSDPWESPTSMIVEMPLWFAARLPLLLGSLLLHSTMWPMIAGVLLGKSTANWLTGAKVTFLLALLTIGEILISTSILLFDRAFFVVPVSMLRTGFFIGELEVIVMEGSEELSVTSHFPYLALILVTRCAVFGGSLFLLRTARIRER